MPGFEKPGKRCKIYLQVMGIENIGVQGEPLGEDSVNIIQSVRDLFPSEELDINVDGSVNDATYQLFKNT